MFGLFIIIAIISAIVSIAIGSLSSGKVDDVIAELNRSHSRRWQISSDYSKALSDLKKLMNDNASSSAGRRSLMKCIVWSRIFIRKPDIGVL